MNLVNCLTMLSDSLYVPCYANNIAVTGAILLFLFPVHMYWKNLHITCLKNSPQNATFTKKSHFYYE